MNYKKILTAGSVAAMALALFASGNNIQAADKKPLQETSSYNLMTKVAGSKNYSVWKTVRNGKVSGKVANAINFRYSHLQSNQKIKTKKYTYWLIYVDGRRVGWVNERFFARNKISVAKKVSLVNNSNYSFNPKDAISYATDKTGSVVDNSKVTVSDDSIDCGEAGKTTVTYKYGSGKAKTQVTVRSSTTEGIADGDSIKPKQGTKSLVSWKSHYGASLNYLNYKDFKPETRKHSWNNNGLTLTTRLYQPVLLSVKTDTLKDGNINRVGHIPEGLTVSNGWAFTSLLSHTNLKAGHIVGYNLNKLENIYNPQKLLTMSQKKFNTYVKNIKVSPYVPIGHGQAMGSTKDYIYVIVNDNSKMGTPASEELLQIRRSDMEINQVWTFKCWNGSQDSPRYFKNGVIVSDNEMYCLWYNKQKDRYEYWEFTRSGDSWTPQLVGATTGTFVGNGEPVQGFTYDTNNENFYIGFNDLIVKLSRQGDLKKSYTFKTGREIEGISISNNRMYANLAQRAELLESNELD